MTFNGSWGYMPCAPECDWHTTRDVLFMLRQVAAGGGNLVLNIGPAPDGSVPPTAYGRLLPVGRWLARNGEAVYGKVDRTAGLLRWGHLGDWTLKGRTAYFWTGRWPGSRTVIAGLKAPLRKASILATGRPIRFEQEPRRLVLKGLPARNPDPVAQIAVLKLEFASRPKQFLGALPCGI